MATIWIFASKLGQENPYFGLLDAFLTKPLKKSETVSLIKCICMPKKTLKTSSNSYLNPKIIIDTTHSYFFQVPNIPNFTSILGSNPIFSHIFWERLGPYSDFLGELLEENELENDKNVVSRPKKIHTYTLWTLLSYLKINLQTHQIDNFSYTVKFWVFA